MTMDRSRISVVVASHNARASVEECLAGLIAQQPVDGAEIVVVDNSTDGTTEIIKQRFSNVRLIVEPPSYLLGRTLG